MSQSIEKNQIFSNQSNANDSISFKDGAYKPLSNIKRQRKQIESDAKLLANRIALLKQEEIKTYKKIDETKKKAYEIYQLKVSNNERIKQRKIQKEHNLFIIKERKKQKQEQNLEEKKKKLDQFKEMKLMHTNKVKQLKEVNKFKKLQNSQQISEEMKLRNQLIRKQEELGKQKIQEYQITKQKFYQEQYLRSYSTEEQVKKLKEMEILRMEKLEAELIQKLQQSQIYQKEAYDQLENALSLKPDEFEDKYIKSQNDQETKNQDKQSPEKAFLTQQNDQKKQDNKELLKEQNQEIQKEDQQIKELEQNQIEQKEQEKQQPKEEQIEQPKKEEIKQPKEEQPKEEQKEQPKEEQPKEEQPKEEQPKQEAKEEQKLQQEPEQAEKNEEIKKLPKKVQLSSFESQLNGLTEQLGLEKQYLKIEYGGNEEITETNESNSDNLKWQKVVSLEFKEDISDLIIKLFAEINSETSLVAEGVLNINSLSSQSQQQDIDLQNKEKQSVGKITLIAILDQQ